MILRENAIMDHITCQKEPMDPGATFEREEGEISDLDLEDVSDCSLSSNKSLGKCNIPKYPNRSRESFYLSCISDSESDYHYGCPSCRTYHCDGFQCGYRKARSHHRRGEKRRRAKYEKHKSSLLTVSCDGSPLSTDWDHNRITRSPSIVSVSNSESDDDVINRSLLRKLNKAVRVNTTRSDELHTSLRTRLQNMVNPVENFEKTSCDSECELMELRKIALESKLNESLREERVEKEETAIKNIHHKQISEEIRTSPSPDTSQKLSANEKHSDHDTTDDDAQQLRINALRSAIIKKHELRRQQKIQTEKEKPQKNINGSELEQDLAQIKTVINDLMDYIINEDENSDSSIGIDRPESRNESKNLVENKENTINSATSTPEPIKTEKETGKGLEEDEDILRAIVLSSIAKNISSSKIPSPEKNKITPPQNLKKTVIQSVKPVCNIPNKTTKAEVPVQRLVIKLGDDSDSESDNAETLIRQKQFEDRLNQLLRTARANAEKQQVAAPKVPLSMQHLPQSRQAEYIRLMDRMNQLTKQNKYSKKKISAQSLTNNALHKTTMIDHTNKQNFLKTARANKKINKFTKIEGVNRNLVNNNHNRKLTNLTSISENSKIHESKTPFSLKRPVSTFAQNLNNQKRFLEGKYKNLAPIVKKTKAARIARDKAGEEVTRLIEQLKKARVKYGECHQTYKNCIQEYMLLKSTLEADTLAERSKRINESNATVLTKKPKLQENVTKEHNINVTATTPRETTHTNTASSIVPEQNSDKVLETHILTLMAPTTSESLTDTASATTSNNSNMPSKIEEHKVKRREIDSNPMIEVCPFDLQGSCRDMECKYRHFGP